MSLYFKGNFVKVELGIGKGKKLYDKREDIARRDAEIRMKKQMAEHWRKNWQFGEIWTVNYTFN